MADANRLLRLTRAPEHEDKPLRLLRAARAADLGPPLLSAKPPCLLQRLVEGQRSSHFFSQLMRNAPAAIAAAKPVAPAASPTNRMVFARVMAPAAYREMPATGIVIASK